MNDTTSKPTIGANAPAAASSGNKPATKTRRPKRMAREPQPGSAPAAPPAAAAKPAAQPRAASKIAGVIALLKREQGATLAELVEATSWLPHTTRAALTGLKKKGHVIAKSSREGTTVYRIEDAA